MSGHFVPVSSFRFQAPLRLPRGGEKPSGWYSPPLGEVGRGLLSFKSLIHFSLFEVEYHRLEADVVVFHRFAERNACQRQEQLHYITEDDKEDKRHEHK